MNSTIKYPIDANRKRCAFTGYRPSKMPFGTDEGDPRCVDFKQRLRNTIEMLIQQGYTHFISGGAMGMDIFAAEAVVDLKPEYPNVILEMVSPYDGQAAKWSADYKGRHDRLFECADITTATGHQYTKGCMFTRNRYLVTNADLLLAAFDGKPGGTAMTVDYAQKMGVQVLCIPPLTTKIADESTSKVETQQTI